MIKIDKPPLPKFMALIIKSNDNDHDVFYTTYQVSSKIHYSRPGFLTFKDEINNNTENDLDVHRRSDHRLESVISLNFSLIN